MAQPKRVKGSVGMNQAFAYYKRNNGTLASDAFRKLIHRINQLLQESLSLGEEIELPQRMGRLEVAKFRTKVRFENGKMITNKAIDWPETKKLWEEDEWCRKNRKYIRFENEFIYRLRYRKQKANYKNKTYIKYYANRDLQRKLSSNIRDNKIEGFLINEEWNTGHKKYSSL